MKKIIIIFAILFFNSANAQVTQEWVATYNGSGTGPYSATRNAIDKFGNLIVAGECDNGSPDYLILKYNSSGSLIWARTYDGTNHNSDQLKDMILDDSGNVYVTGSSNEGASGGYFNWLTIKYSPDGELRWIKNLDWTEHKEDIPFSITLDKNRNVFVAGYGWATGGIMNFDMILAKYNNDGVEQWTRSYDTQPFHTDWGYSVVTDDSNCAYISGYSYPSNVITIKYDGSGNQKWLKEYPRMSSEYAIPLFSKIDKQNNIIVNGYYKLSNQSNFVTLKYNRNGYLEWDRIFDSPIGAADFANAINVDDSSNVYITGSTFTNFYYDVLVVKYSAKGDTLWVKTFDNGMIENDIGNSIITDKQQNVYITGSTYTQSDDDFLTLKYDLNGNLIWSRTYSLLNTNISYSISLDNYQNIYISGYNDLSFNNSAAITIKYSQMTEIHFNNIEEVERFQLNNYPNPFNPATRISYELLNASNVKLEVFDMSGKLIKELINSRQNRGNYNLSFDGNNLASGIYFCNLIINNIKTEIIKMLLLK